MNFKYTLSACFFLLLALLVSCAQDFPLQAESRADKLRVRFDFQEMPETNVRAATFPTLNPGTTTDGNNDENYIESVLIVFFDAAGKKVKFLKQEKPYFYYNVASPIPTDWENNSTASQTVILPITPEEALDKTVMVIANAPAELRDALTEKDPANEIKTQTELEAYRAKLISNADELEKPFLMRGEKKVDNTVIQDTRVLNTIPVELERAIARVDFVIHYDWDKLVPNHATGRGFRTLQQFDQETYVGVQTTINATRVDGTRTVIPKTNDAAPTAQTTFTEYINEYKLADDNAPLVKAPYVLLELPAILGKDWAAANAPYFPPPAGGEKEFDMTPVMNFYKLVMPREIKRNHYYRIHVYVIGAGAADADSAIPLTVNFTVLPWENDFIVFDNFLGDGLLQDI